MTQTQNPVVKRKVVLVGLEPKLEVLQHVKEIHGVNVEFDFIEHAQMDPSVDFTSSVSAEKYILSHEDETVYFLEDAISIGMIRYLKDQGLCFVIVKKNAMGNMESDWINAYLEAEKPEERDVKVCTMTEIADLRAGRQLATA